MSKRIVYDDNPQTEAEVEFELCTRIKAKGWKFGQHRLFSKGFFPDVILYNEEGKPFYLIEVKKEFGSLSWDKQHFKYTNSGIPFIYCCSNAEITYTLTKLEKYIESLQIKLPV